MAYATCFLDLVGNRRSIGIPLLFDQKLFMNRLLLEDLTLEQVSDTFLNVFLSSEVASRMYFTIK